MATGTGGSATTAARASKAKKGPEQRLKVAQKAAMLLKQVSERLLGPFGLPLLALTLIGVIMISLSRVLLAVPKNGSVIVDDKDEHA